METDDGIDFYETSRRFKSYYVVWKPQIAANPKQSLQEV